MRSRLATIHYQSDYVIDLAREAPFASGDNRLCFRHPDDAGLCIKVLRSGRAKQLYSASPFYKRMFRETYFDDNRREFAAYQQPAIVRNKCTYHYHVARCYGWVRTNLGDGLVTDLITDLNGNPAQTLEDYLSEHGLDAVIQDAASNLAFFFRTSLILTKNLMPHNLVLAPSDQGYRLVLIDGLGLSTFLPLAKYSHYFARRHIEKRLQWFYFRLKWEVSDRSISWRDTEATFRFSTIRLEVGSEE